MRETEPTTTAPMPVEPRPGVYGTYGDATLLADFLELVALKGVTVSRAQLADLVADTSLANWRARDEELFIPAGEPAPSKTDEDDEKDAAARVFDLLLERRSLLGAEYPFDVTAERIAAATVPATPNSYLGLLAITVAHSYALTTGRPATEVFESFVTEVIRERCLDVSNFARDRAAFPTFDDAVIATGTTIGFQPTPSAAPRKRMANDEKGDVLAHLHWQDNRSDTWGWVGQVTCAQTQEWEKKIEETSDRHWKAYLGIVGSPMVFLAVPHHADEVHRLYITTRSERVLLDRPRLARRTSPLSADEMNIWEVVVATDWALP